MRDPRRQAHERSARHRRPGHGRVQPGTACWGLYDQLVADRVLGWDELEPQLRDAIEANKTTDARKFVQYMFEPRDQKTYDLLIKDPMKWLTRQDRLPVGRNERAGDHRAGAPGLRRQRGRFLSAPRMGQVHGQVNLAWVRGQYALAAALNLDSRANDWYHEAGHIRMTEYNAGWKVRAALRQPKIDWKWVIESIDEMPPANAPTPPGSTGRRAAWPPPAAGPGPGRLRQHRRPLRLLRPAGRRGTGPPHHGAAASRADHRRRDRRGARQPGLRRAVQLFRLGWRAEAVPEWNFALRGASDRQLMAAAELARAENIYDRVVNTSDRTEENSISASASSRPSRAASRPRPTPSRWTRPGSTA